MAVFNLSSWVKRAFGLQDHNALAGYSESYAGKPVTPQTALGLSTFWACVRLVSESIACLPCGVYELDAQRDKVAATDTELYRILHDSPNADMSPIEFFQALVAMMLIWGNAYGYKNYRGTGLGKKLVSVDPLRSDLMSLRINEDGSTTYIYAEQKGRREFTEDEIMHVKGFSLDGRIGLSVIGYARQSLGNSMALEETSGRLYSNGMRPAGALTIPNVLKEDQRTQIRKSIADQVGGVSKTGGLIVLEAGMDYKALGMPPEDAQMLESRAFGVEEICRWFGVPPILVQHGEKTTTWGTGLEQINLGFLTYTLTPWIKRLEQSFKRSLLSPVERVKLFPEFNLDAFMRADSAGKAAYYNSAANNGWMSRAEIRRKENLPYIEGSDELTVQSALVPLDQLGQLPAAPTPAKEVVNAA